MTPTRQELLVIATAVVGVLMWLACAVMAIENVRGEAPQLPHTSDAGTPAVIYGEDTKR